MQTRENDMLTAADVETLRALVAKTEESRTDPTPEEAADAAVAVAIREIRKARGISN